MAASHIDKLLTTAEAAAELRVSKNYLEQLRCAGGGPRFCRLGAKAVRYRNSDLAAWIEASIRGSTSDRRAAP